jgi:hypothetical protein
VISPLSKKSGVQLLKKLAYEVVLFWLARCESHAGLKFIPLFVCPECQESNEVIAPMRLFKHKNKPFMENKDMGDDFNIGLCFSL